MELIHAGCTGDLLELGQSGQCAILMEQTDRKVGVGVTIPSCSGYTNILAKRELEVVMKIAIWKESNDCSRTLCVWGERK